MIFIFKYIHNKPKPITVHLTLCYFAIILPILLTSEPVMSIRVTLYSKNNFEGDSIEKSVYTCQNIPKYFNDKTKSVKIFPERDLEACTVLYEHSCCGGRSYEVGEEGAALNELDGKVSSLSPCGAYPKAAPSPAPRTLTLENWENSDNTDYENKTVALVEENSSIAVYFGDQVKREGMTWPVKLLTLAWAYVKKTYGSFGYGGAAAGKLYTVLQIGPKGYISGYPHLYLNCEAGFRSLIHVFSGHTTQDVGNSSTPWAQDHQNELLPRSKVELDMIFNILATIVESSNNGVLSSPTQAIWGNRIEPWVSIFTYDLYLNIGLKEEAQRILNLNMVKKIDSPDYDYMFMSWFLPIYRKYGGGLVLSKFFQLISHYFPQSEDPPYFPGEKTHSQYQRQMNIGEFIHFWSGAVGVSLKEQATAVFGWTKNTASEFERARKDFTAITDKYME